MLVENAFTVDVNNPKPIVLHAVQGDSMRSVVLTLQKDGAAYNPESDLASGESIKGAVLCNKPDGTKVAYEKASWQASGAKAVTKVSAGKYRAYFDDQCFAAAGHATIYVRLYAVKSGANTGKILHTFAITAAVEKNPAANIQSKDYINLPSQAELAAKVARAVLYDPQTTFSSSEKKTARNNIEASNRRIWANVWSKNNTYSYGDYAIYSDWLYRYVGTTSGNGADNNGNWDSTKWLGSTFASVVPKCVRNDIDQKFNNSQKYKARNNIEAARKGYIATAYSSSATYAVGDWAMVYDSVNQRDVIKECTVAISTPEAYTPAHWSSANMSVGSTIANILRQLQNLMPGDEEEGESGEVVVENNFVYCDYDIPSATTPATETEISASAFYPLPTQNGDIVFGRNGKLAEVTDLTYDPTDASVLVSVKVSGILDRFSGRDDLTEAYAEQQTYSSVINFLANQGTGKYVVTSGSGATARVYYADNDLVGSAIVSKISAYTMTSLTEYIYIGGTQISSVSYVSSGNGVSFANTHVFGRDPQLDYEFVTLHYLNNNRKPQIFNYDAQNAPEELGVEYGEYGTLVFQEENDIQSRVSPSVKPIVGDVLIEQGTSNAAVITGIDDEYDPQLQGWGVTVRGLGKLYNQPRQPQILRYAPPDPDNELPASGSATLELQEPLKDHLQPNIDPVIGDVLYDHYTGNMARISGAPDREVGGYYCTDVVSLGFVGDARIPAAPSTDGTYTLTATVADGEVTYSWT